MNEKTPGSIIFATIEKNEYLNELYDNIIYNYSVKLFGLTWRELKPVNVDDALRFADLLSKSNHPKKADSHRIWAQEIVALLKYIHPKHPSIQYFLGSVLSNTGNYLGMTNQTPNYSSKNLLERFYSEYSQDIMSIPAVPDERFLRSQKAIYERLNEPYLSYSAPTSMGKSFVMRMFIKKLVLDGANLNFAIIVPTKALINEVSHKLHKKDFDGLLVPADYKIVTSPGSIFLKKDHNFIFVLTPERLLYLLISYPDIPINYLFIDEAHKISSQDSRSPFYYKTIDALSRKNPNPHIIFASPNIPNPEVYLKLLPFTNLDESAVAAKFSPVSQMKYFIDYPSRKIHLYNKRTEELSLLTTIRTDPHISIIKIIDAIGRGSKNIIYCRSKDKAIELARAFADGKPQIIGDKDLEKLAGRRRQIP